MSVTKHVATLVSSLLAHLCALILMVSIIGGPLIFINESFRTSSVKAIAALSPIPIRITRLTSPSITQWSADMITVGAQGSEWFVIQGFELRWDPSVLFEQKLELNLVQVDSIIVSTGNIMASRLVQDKAQPKEESSGKNNFLRYLPDMNLDTVAIKSLVIDDHERILIRSSVFGSFSKKTLRIAPTQIKIGKSINELSADITADRVSVSVDINQLPLDLFKSKIPTVGTGRLDLSLTFTGQPNNIRTHGQAYVIRKDAQDKELTADLYWKTHKTMIQGALEIYAQPGIGQRFEFKVPKHTYEAYFSNQNHPPLLPLDASITASADVSALNAYLDPGMHRLSGKLSAQFTLSGHVNAPKFSGTISTDSVRYDHLPTGFIIDDFNCRINAIQNTFSVASCMARDDLFGRYTLAGQFSYVDNKPAGFIVVYLQDVSPARLEFVESSIDGQAKVNLTTQGVQIESDMQLSKLTLDLSAIASSDIPSIKTKEKQKQPLSRKNKDTPAPFVTVLDISVEAKNKAYLRGRGLDAELSGALKLTGSLDDPRVKGNFNIVRGKLELFNKTFNLEQGDFTIVNQSMLFYVKGRYRRKNQEILIELSGSNDDVSASFSAVPEMPEDEILAWIVFSKPLNKITPFEAYQFAAAVQKLRGEKPLFDPLEKSRKLVGADRLTIEGGQGEGAPLEVGVGKYLSERVYLELKRTTNSVDPWRASVEVELSPNLNLESSIDSDTGASGIELNWQQDY